MALDDSPSTWSEGHRFVTQVGREDHLAARITAERHSRGWSQETLAKEMEKIGCPIPQSAISRIENPAASTGGRRDISVREAIAFSKLFDVPLGELVLPVDARGAVVAFGYLADGPAALHDAHEAQQRHALNVIALALLTVDDERWTTRLVDELNAAQVEQRKTPAKMTQAAERLEFVRDVITYRDKLRAEPAYLVEMRVKYADQHPALAVREELTRQLAATKPKGRAKRGKR
jgi:transcriptional regulator with XRE-family HTH domain